MDVKQQGGGGGAVEMFYLGGAEVQLQKKGTRDGCLFRKKVSFSGRARLAGSWPAETPFT